MTRLAGNDMNTIQTGFGFWCPMLAKKNEYLKTVYAYDQEAKKNGLNLVNTSKENKLF